ncbi:hypothetical protein D3C71_2251090 [compost metagenome]
MTSNLKRCPPLASPAPLKVTLACHRWSPTRVRGVVPQPLGVPRRFRLAKFLA